MLKKDHHFSGAPLRAQAKGSQEWLAMARAWAMARAEERGTVCADDIWYNVPPPKGLDRRVVIGVFFPREVWEVAGRKPSTRSACHGRQIVLYRLRSSGPRTKRRSRSVATDRRAET